MKDYNIDINDFTKCLKEYGISVKKGTGRITLDGKDIRLSEMFESQLTEAKQKMSVTQFSYSDVELKIKGISMLGTVKCPVISVTAA